MVCRGPQVALDERQQRNCGRAARLSGRHVGPRAKVEYRATEGGVDDGLEVRGVDEELDVSAPLRDGGASVLRNHVLADHCARALAHSACHCERDAAVLGTRKRRRSDIDAIQSSFQRAETIIERVEPYPRQRLGVMQRATTTSCCPLPLWGILHSQRRK